MKTLVSLNITYFAIPVAIYLFLSIGSLLTVTPNCDEAWFTVPAYELVENGGFGTTILDETAVFRQVKLDGIQKYTYWIMPGYPVFRAVAGIVIGWGIYETRLLSLMLGMFALLGLMYCFRKLLDEDLVAFVAGLLVATDIHFIRASGFGRMDIITLAFGAGSIAAYFFVRERLGFSIARSLLLASFLSAVAFFIHPVGIIWVSCLILVVFYLDRVGLRFPHLIPFGVPFVLGAALWLIYIAQAPDLFFLQFGGNASDRWAIFLSPVAAIRDEIVMRYLGAFGYGDENISFGSMKLWVVFTYLSCVVAATRFLYKHKRPFSLLLAAMFLIPAMLLLVIDGMKQIYYFVHLVPIFCLCVAIVTVSVWGTGRSRKALSILLVGSVMIVNIATLTSRYVGQGMARFQNAANALNSMMSPGETVIASGEFWFKIDKTKKLIDDYRLGAISGRKSDFFVIDKQRYSEWQIIVGDKEEATRQHIDTLVANSELVYDDGFYWIFRTRFGTGNQNAARSGHSVR